MYTILFLGLPVLGVWFFLRVRERMAVEKVPSPPEASLLAVFAAYGAVLLFAVSSVFDKWSGMHSIASVGLVFVGAPWLLVQGVVLHRHRARSPYHEAVSALSLAFPLVLGAFVWVVLALDKRP
jgi:hypothetical protein